MFVSIGIQFNILRADLQPLKFCLVCGDSWRWISGKLD